MASTSPRARSPPLHISSRNAAFVARYKKQHGDDEPTNMCAEAAYFQVHIFANALAQTNSVCE
jgi:ABC-type branched-subunit amino acid transport system substrate-binding protein